MSDPTEIPEYIHANCKVCGTRVTPKAKNAGRRLKCPDCETPIQLPTIEQYMETRRQQALSEPRQPEPVEPYTLQEQVERVERTEATVSVFRELATVKREEAPPPPPYPFFSNVFEFPWKTPDAFIRWGMLAAGGTGTGLMLGVNHWLISEYGTAGMLGSAFFGLALITVTAWSLSFASSCMLAIIHDTSAGLDQVEGWPDGGVREWMVDMFTILYVFFVAGFVGLVIGKPIEFAIGVLSPQVFLVQGLVFPLALLGAYDSESVWFPWSPVVVRSVKIMPRDWLIFYGLSFALAGVGFGFLGACLYKSTWLFGFMLGPVLSSQMFIFSRLLGRIAWRIGETAPHEQDDTEDDDSIAN
ncbi:MAG: hypothetical protein ACYTGL_13070 [Planctomycetota bacterium]